ncbi:MAG TPA: SPOR domain-containing protein [Candidatus Binatia bacterium]|nr:SPOR domain-containing protein [Candidatus Binatia bacterium]
MALITTPASYYSTPKARYLGERYKENLDRLVEGIVRHPKTANLQFANNIAAVGGIGFFTHSAVKSPDERYLEVILAAPETFEMSGEFSSKVHRLFSLYGTDLLSVLSSDSAIYNEKEVSGYALNLSWRKIVADPRGPRVALERAIVYFPKQRVRAFLTRQVSQEDLLSEAVMFAAEDQGSINLVSYRPSELKPDLRAPIQEEDIATAKLESEAQSEVPSQPTTPQAAPARTAKVEKKIETSEAKQRPANEAKLEGAAEAAKPTASGSSRPAAAPAPSTLREGASAAKTVSAAPREKKAIETVTDSAALIKDRANPNAAKQAVPETKPESAAISPMETGRSEQPLTPARPLRKVEQQRSDEHQSRSQSLGETKVPQRAVDQGAAQEKKVSAPAVSPKEPTNIAGPSEPPFSKKQEKDGETKDRDVASRIPSSKIPAQSQGGNETRPQSLPKEEIGEAAKSKVPAGLRAEGNEQKTNESKNQPRVSAPIAAGAKTPVSEKKSETAAAVTKLEDRVATGSRPAPAPAFEAKQENSGAAATRNTSAQTEVEKRVPDPQPGVLKKAEPPPVLANKEMKTAAFPKAPPTPIAAAKDEASGPKDPGAASPAEPIKPAAPIRSAERKKAEPVPAAPKAAPAAAEAKAAPVQAQEEKPATNSANEQIALLRNQPSETAMAKKPLIRPGPKALEGYVIQVAFNERAKAKHWAEAMEQRGYAVSVTETGGAGSVRVRVGNFAAADEAERQLRTFRQEGLTAIVINLPQAFRPAATAQAEESPSP